MKKKKITHIGKNIINKIKIHIKKYIDRPCALSVSVELLELVCIIPVWSFISFVVYSWLKS
jgi:hypothetical protein